MDWIHCNKCHSQLEPGITLHLTSCGHMFCNNCLDNGTKEKQNATCLVCRLPCSIMKLVPDMKPEVQDYFTEPEEFIKKCSEVLQFQKQHRRRLLSYLLQSTKKFYLARTELKRMTEICQKQHKQLKECQKTIKNLESQLTNQKKQSPFNIPISPGCNLSPAFVQGPGCKRTAKSTPYSAYQSNLVTPSRISKQRPACYSASSQRSNTSNKISSTVYTPLTPDSAGVENQHRGQRQRCALCGRKRMHSDHSLARMAHHCGCRFCWKEVKKCRHHLCFMKANAAVSNFLV